jgi:hypothetical protein
VNPTANTATVDKLSAARSANLSTKIFPPFTKCLSVRQSGRSVSAKTDVWQPRFVRLSDELSGIRPSPRQQPPTQPPRWRSGVASGGFEWAVAKLALAATSGGDTVGVARGCLRRSEGCSGRRGM